MKTQFSSGSNGCKFSRKILFFENKQQTGKCLIIIISPFFLIKTRNAQATSLQNPQMKINSFKKIKTRCFNSLSIRQSFQGSRC